MREILFRGKVKDSCHEEHNGEWTTGSYVHRTKFYGDPDDEHFILYSGEFDGDYYDEFTVDPATVGQFTGLYDKNGKKIFEGDIVRENSGDYLLFCYDSSIRRKRSHRAVVTFGRHVVPSDDPWEWGEAYGFYLAPAGEVFTPQISAYRPKNDDYGNGFSLEVIGNIHDNPELLEAHNEDN